MNTLNQHIHKCECASLYMYVCIYNHRHILPKTQELNVKSSGRPTLPWTRDWAEMRSAPAAAGRGEDSMVKSTHVQKACGLPILVIVSMVLGR